MKNNLKLVTAFYITLLTFSISIGIIYAFEVIDISQFGTDFFDTFMIISLNNLFVEVGVLSISFLLSFILMGEIIFFIYFLIKSFALGFLICTFVKIYTFKGILISLIYLASQIIIFLVLFFFMYEILKLCKTFASNLLMKKTLNLSSMFKTVKKLIFLFIIFISYNIFIYFLQTPLINLFKLITA